MVLLGFYETWLKDGAGLLAPALNVSMKAPPIKSLNKARGGVEIIFKPSLKYQIRHGRTKSEILAVIVKVASKRLRVYI